MYQGRILEQLRMYSRVAKIWPLIVNGSEEDFRVAEYAGVGWWSKTASFGDGFNPTLWRESCPFSCLTLHQ